MAFWLLWCLKSNEWIFSCRKYVIVPTVVCYCDCIERQNIFINCGCMQCSVIQLMHCLKMVNQWVCCPVLSFEGLAAQIASWDMGAPWPWGLIGLLATIVPDIGGPVILLVRRPCSRWCRVMHTWISWNEMRTKRSHYFWVFSRKWHHTASTKATTKISFQKACKPNIKILKR